jgi:hypothetical protein
MDRFPQEIRILILKETARSLPKSEAVKLRLISREFDTILKPVLCRTISLDISKLNKVSRIKHPDPAALEAIGSLCDSLFVDLAVVKDEGTHPLRFPLPLFTSVFCPYRQAQPLALTVADPGPNRDTR